MRLSIDLPNARLVRQGAQNLDAEIPQVGRRQIRTSLNRIIRIMQAYPPERPGQYRTGSHPILGTTYIAVRYKRTGRLGRSWVIERKGDNGYVIKNDARSPKTRKRYAQYVVGNAYGAGQAWMHKGRWDVFRDVVDDEMQTLPAPINREIEMVARRNNV